MNINFIIILFTIIWSNCTNANSEFGRNDSKVIANSISDHGYEQLQRHATFCALAYATKYDLLSLGELQSACVCSLCKQAQNNIYVETVHRGTVNGVIFRDDNYNEIILAIKGTTSTNEWVMDFKIFPMPYHYLGNRKKGWKKFLPNNKECKGCTVHKGFYSGAKEIYDNMFGKLVEIMDEYPEYSVVVTGHSLGGAIAPIIGNELLFMQKHTIVSSFGSPKFGNKAFMSWLDSIWNTDSHYDDIDSMFYKNAYVRVSHKDDIVPWLPTKQMRYNHAGVDIYFNTNKIPMKQEHIEIKNSPKYAVVVEDTEGLDHTFLEKNNGFSIDSHRDYILRMNQCVKVRDGEF